MNSYPSYNQHMAMLSFSAIFISYRDFLCISHGSLQRLEVRTTIATTDELQFLKHLSLR